MRCSSRCAGMARRRRCWSAGASPPTARKHLLHLAVGNKESEACWTEFFRYPARAAACGCRPPSPPTARPGWSRRSEVCFPASIRIRCWFHRLANIRAKLPDETAVEVMAHLYAGPRRPHPRRRPRRRGPAGQHLRLRVPGGGRPASKTTWTRCWRSTGSRSGTASGCARPTWRSGRFVEERRRTKVIRPVRR